MLRHGYKVIRRSILDCWAGLLCAIHLSTAWRLVGRVIATAWQGANAHGSIPQGAEEGGGSSFRDQGTVSPAWPLISESNTRLTMHLKTLDVLDFYFSAPLPKLASVPSNGLSE